MIKKRAQAFVDELTLLSHKYQIVICQYPDNIASPPILDQMGGYTQGFGRYMIPGESGQSYLEWHNSHWSVVEDYLAWAKALRKEEKQSVSKARLVKIVIEHPAQFDKAQYAHKIGQIGQVVGIDQTDFVFHHHIRFADGMTGIFLDEEIEEVQ